MKHVLVTYASRTGSTVGVAEMIGDCLTKKGFPVDVFPMQEMVDLSPYCAVIAGSAIHGKQWLPEAIEFVETHRDTLVHKPFAAFLVCMTLALTNEQWRDQAGVSEWMAPVRALVRPTCEGYFAGVLDIDKVPSFSERMKFRASVLTGVWEEGDHRDWEAIRNWADELPHKLRIVL